MSSPSNAYRSATIVELAGYRRSSRLGSAGSRVTTPAQLLSMRQNLDHQASVEIDDLPWLQAQFPDGTRERVVNDIRTLLNHEFGHLRVHRYRELFSVRHRSIEGLIAGLLRVQFHARQIHLPNVNIFDEMIEQKGFTLTWGIGQTASEAENERQKYRRQKNYRR